MLDYKTITNLGYIVYRFMIIKMRDSFICYML